MITGRAIPRVWSDAATIKALISPIRRATKSHRIQVRAAVSPTTRNVRFPEPESSGSASIIATINVALMT